MAQDPVARSRVNIFSDVTRSKRAPTAREFHTFIINQLEINKKSFKTRKIRKMEELKIKNDN